MSFFVLAGLTYVTDFIYISNPVEIWWLVAIFNIFLYSISFALFIISYGSA